MIVLQFSAAIEGSVWKVQKLEDAGVPVLSLSGRIEGENLADLKKAIAVDGKDGSLVLDLEAVQLVDREVVRFLARCEASGAELRNCPAYVREWITRDGNGN